MRLHKPFHLDRLDPNRAADEVVREVYQRARRDAGRVGLTLQVDYVPPGYDQKTSLSPTMDRSKAYKAARACADWATTGKGKPEEIAAALKELCADLDVELGKSSRREPDLATASGVLVVAAAARLALKEGRAVTAVEVATLASVDDRTIRAAAQEGELQPVGPGRPMRFAADGVCEYLYRQGVPGFVAPPGAPTA